MLLSVKGIFSIVGSVLLAIIGLAWTSEESTGATPEPVAVYLFWTQTCPHCTKARRFLGSLGQRVPGVEIHSLELGADERHERAFVTLSKHYGIDPPAVPLIVIGDDAVVGYDEDTTTGVQIEARIAACRSKTCPNVAGEHIRRVDPALSVAGETAPLGTEPHARPMLPDVIMVPGIGNIDPRALSLPALTVVLGAIDGFNPCAMWVLVFLIGLLVGMQDPVRMWSYGAVFLLTSAAVYFAFMAAWLNVFLFLGSLSWVRTAIGIFAIGVGGYYLWQFATNPEAACPITSPGKRERVMAHLKATVAERSFLLAVAGLIVLAVGVNLIEILCSAGIPAIYTQVLALSDLSTFEHYAYLTLYISVFLLDDVIVFVTAMVTLRAAGLTASYARYSHLIGGIILAIIGALLLFKPGWLSFA
jgi:glutaredoxin